MLTVGVTDDGRTRKAYACLASSTYFQTLGVTPPVGRACLPAEDSPSAAPVAVVSRAYWERNGGEAALGRRLTINNHAFTIVGVVPERFSGTTALLSPEFWLPLGPLRPARTGRRGLVRRVAGRREVPATQQRQADRAEVPGADNHRAGPGGPVRAGSANGLHFPVRPLEAQRHGRGQAGGFDPGPAAQARQHQAAGLAPAQLVVATALRTE